MLFNLVLSFYCHWKNQSQAVFSRNGSKAEFFLCDFVTLWLYSPKLFRHSLTIHRLSALETADGILPQRHHMAGVDNWRGAYNPQQLLDNAGGGGVEHGPFYLPVPHVACGVEPAGAHPDKPPVIEEVSPQICFYSRGIDSDLRHAGAGCQHQRTGYAADTHPRDGMALLVCHSGERVGTAFSQVHTPMAHRQ